MARVPLPSFPPLQQLTPHQPTSRPLSPVLAPPKASLSLVRSRPNKQNNVTPRCSETNRYKSRLGLARPSAMSDPIDDSLTEDIWASPDAERTDRPTTPRTPRTPKTPNPRTPGTHHGEYDREAALRKELESVRNINASIEGVISTLERAKSNMGVRCPRAPSPSVANADRRACPDRLRHSRQCLDPPQHMDTHPLPDRTQPATHPQPQLAGSHAGRDGYGGRGAPEATGRRAPRGRGGAAARGRETEAGRGRGPAAAAGHGRKNAKRPWPGRGARNERDQGRRFFTHPRFQHLRAVIGKQDRAWRARKHSGRIPRSGRQWSRRIVKKNYGRGCCAEYMMKRSSRHGRSP